MLLLEVEKGAAEARSQWRAGEDGGGGVGGEGDGVMWMFGRWVGGWCGDVKGKIDGCMEGSYALFCYDGQCVCSLSLIVHRVRICAAEVFDHRILF